MGVRHKDMGRVEAPAPTFFFGFCDFLHVASTTAFVPPDKVTNLNRRTVGIHHDAWLGIHPSMTQRIRDEVQRHAQGVGGFEALAVKFLSLLLEGFAHG